MEKFSDRQKKISLALMKGEKTIQELQQTTTIHKENIEDSLKKMIELKLVEQNQNKYKLNDTILKELKKRKEIIETDPFELRIHAIIEMQAVEKELLEKHLNQFTKSIKEDEHFTVYNVTSEEIIQTEEDGMFSTFIQTDITLKDFKSIIYFMFFYGPSSVEVIRPKEIKLQAEDLQEGLMDLAEMVQKYTEYITSIMKEKDLQDFTKKLYE